MEIINLLAGMYYESDVISFYALRDGKLFRIVEFRVEEKKLTLKNDSGMEVPDILIERMIAKFMDNEGDKNSEEFEIDLIKFKERKII